MKDYKPFMDNGELSIGEKMVFKFRSTENVISLIIGEIISFGSTNDGINYSEADVGNGKTRKYVMM